MTVRGGDRVRHDRDIWWLWRTTRSLGIGLFDNHINYFDGDLATAPDVRDAIIRISNALGVTSGVATTIPTDVVFVIDTTSSMSSAIGSVRRDVHEIVRVLDEQSPDFRVGLVAYRDFTDGFQAAVVTPFTSDVQEFGRGLDGLVAAGGGDRPESVYSGLRLGLAMKWRADVRRTVVLIGDAPPHDPEPGTGLTRDDIVRRALGVDVVTDTRTARTGPDEALPPGPVALYAVNSGGATDTSAAFGALADATGGRLIDPAAGTVSDQVRSALLAAGRAPDAGVTATFARAGQEARLSAAGTFAHPDDPVVAYDWNLGLGTPLGSFDVTTTEPRLDHVYDEPGEYLITMRARTASGLAGVATATLVVDPPFTRVPHTPRDVVAVAGDADGEVHVSWVLDPEAYWYTFLDADLEVVESYSWFESEWILADLPPGEPFTFYLSAGNDLGTSAPAGPFTVTPTGAAPPAPEPTSSPAASDGPSGPTAPSGPAAGTGGDDGAATRIVTDGTPSASPTGLVSTGAAVVLILLGAGAASAAGLLGVRAARARRTVP